MNNDLNQQRRSGPHAPLPAAIAAPTDAPRSTGIQEQSKDDPRARAAARAAELREHGGATDDGLDEFYINPDIVPDGWGYEYKRLTVLGQPDPSYQVGLAQRGWEAVPASRHPELMPDGYTGNTIERHGQILMERPSEITDEVKARDLRRAREQVRGKEAQLSGTPSGTLPRDSDPRTAPRIKKSFEAGMPIPDK